MTPDLQTLREERNAALRTLDIKWARKKFPSASSDEVLLIALHKTRYECVDIEDAFRLESAEWLRARGYEGMFGPLLPPGKLPR